MALEIVQHSHCHVCGRVVKHGETSCSDKCKGELDRSRRSRQRMMFVMYAMAGLFVLMLVFNMIAGG